MARYRSVSRDALPAGLAGAQQDLLAAAAGVPERDLARTGWHEFDGEVPLAGLPAFLPRRQAGHADQLGLLT
ncbi:MAG TPA: hypothetical protein VKV80_14630 [Streptosporangiaceae bacterium]|jgi:hypothetical protein|nr:hypothetical protein [Streptosporangiaceae bacterium]